MSLNSCMQVNLSYGSITASWWWWLWTMFQGRTCFLLWSPILTGWLCDTGQYHLRTTFDRSREIMLFQLSVVENTRRSKWFPPPWLWLPREQGPYLGHVCVSSAFTLWTLHPITQGHHTATNWCYQDPTPVPLSSEPMIFSDRSIFFIQVRDSPLFHGSLANEPSWSLFTAVIIWAINRNAFRISDGSHASENDYKVPQTDLCGACSRKGREGGQGWNKDMMSMTLAVGTEYKEAPKNLSNPRKYI